MRSPKTLIKNSLKALLPIKSISVSEWADEYAIISAGNAEPGRWKTSRAEYQREIMNAFTQPGVHVIAAKLASQTGKSSIMNNVMGRFAHVDPCTILMVQPTVELAENYSKERIAPFINDTKVLRNIFYGSGKKLKSRDANQTILSKIFKGGRLVFVGANAPSGLASRPIRILLCDEVDRFPASAGPEGDPVGLAEKRMTTFWNYKMGLFSTPTVEGISRIDVEYLAGTQEEWQHQCPNCKEFHAPDYRQMITDYHEITNAAGVKSVVVNSVKWKCPDCGFEWTELEMKNAPQKYVAQNPDAVKNGIRSFWVSGFSSPWLTWKKIMEEYYKAKGSPALEQVFFNTRLGVSYKQAGEYDDENEFLNRREDYFGEIPQEVLLLTAAVDVQKNRLEYEIVGWTEQEECFGILRGIVRGSPNEGETWKNLNAVLDREYHFPNGTPIKVARTFIDSGYSTRVVYEYCRENVYTGKFPIKGTGAIGVPLLYRTSYPPKAGVILTILGVNDGKQEVMSRLGIRQRGRNYFRFPNDDEFLGVRGYDSAYFKQLIAEKGVIRKSGGILYKVFEPITKDIRNESLDLRVYNLAAMKSCIGQQNPENFWVKMIAAVRDFGERPVEKRLNRAIKARTIKIF